MLHSLLPKAQIKGEGHKDTWRTHIRYATNDTLLDITICGEQGSSARRCPAYIRQRFTGSVKGDAIAVLAVMYVFPHEEFSCPLFPADHNYVLYTVLSRLLKCRLLMWQKVWGPAQSPAQQGLSATGQKGCCAEAVTLLPDNRDCWVSVSVNLACEARVREAPQGAFLFFFFLKRQGSRRERAPSHAKAAALFAQSLKRVQDEGIQGKRLFMFFLSSQTFTSRSPSQGKALSAPNYQLSPFCPSQFPILR